VWIDFKDSDDLTDADRAALNTLRLSVYPPDVRATLPALQFAWAPVQWHFLVYDDAGHLVSHVGVLTREVLLDGALVRIGGVGGVQTHPDARGQGYASAAMERAAIFFHDEAAVPFALLFCGTHRVSFYGGLGWQRFNGLTTVAQPGGNIPFNMNETLVRSARRDAPTDGILDLQGLPW